MQKENNTIEKDDVEKQEMKKPERKKKYTSYTDRIHELRQARKKTEQDGGG